MFCLRRSLLLLVAVCLQLGALAPLQVQAQAQTQTPAANQLPTGGQVSAGQASISQSGSTLTVNQSSQRAAIDWGTFNVGSQAQVNFQQPNAQSATLNRVADINPSQIFGRIVAPGQVILINPQGVYFGASAVVDVGGLVATTHQQANADFMAGSNTYTRQGATGSVINEGTLRAALGGYIALLAPQVQNKGLIVANLGTVALAAGDQYELQFNNGSLTNVRVSGATLDTLIDNRLAVKAPGGLVILSAIAASKVQSAVVNNSGSIEANGFARVGGRIVLTASSSVNNSGTVSANATADGPAGSVSINAPTVVNSGTISAANLSSAVTGRSVAGSIAVQADTFTQTTSGTLDVSALGGAAGSVTVQASDVLTLMGNVLANGALADPSDIVANVLGGNVVLQATRRVDIQGAVLDASGAGGAGRIHVQADGLANDPLNNGNPTPGAVHVNQAVLRVASTNGQSRGQGGRVEVEGDEIVVDGVTVIDARGATGGGTVLIGGDWQGSGALRHATTVYFSADSRIDASATDDGNGGKVVLWSDVGNANSLTTALGSLYARGGANGGNGGQIETSGHTVNTDGVYVNAGADQGTGGLWLIDPSDSNITSSVASGYVTSLNNGTSVTNQVTGNITMSGVTLTKTSGGDATLLLQTITNSGTTGVITLSNSTISSTSGKLNLVLDTDCTAIGYESRISISGSTLNTNGGNLWVGGGVAWNNVWTSTGTANTWGVNQQAVYVGASNISTGVGSMTFNGLSWYSGGTAGTTNMGVWIAPATTGTTLSATSGSITINGTTSGYYATGQAVLIGSYDSTITGKGNTILSTTSGAITLNGTLANDTSGSVNWRNSLFLSASDNAGDQTVLKSTSGAIKLTGTSSANYSGGDGSGLQLQVGNTSGSLQVVSQSGNISLIGSNSAEASSQYANGIRLTASNAANTLRIGYDGSNPYSGNILLQSNSILLRNTNSTAGSLSVQTTGSLTIAPLGSSFTYLRAGSSGTLTFDNNWNFGTALSGFTLGSTTSTASITLSNAISVAGPITVYGGTLTLAGVGLTSTASGAAVQLIATGDILIVPSASITTNGGAILLAADSDNSGAGGIEVYNASLTSNGGNITLGGGAANGSGYAKGLSSSGNTSYTPQNGMGIDIRGSSGSSSTTNINAGGGNIVINGKGAASGTSGQYVIGINMTFLPTIQTSGSGTITINGVGGGNYDTGSYGVGVNFFTGTTISSGSGAISITGTSGTGTASAYGGIYYGGGSGNVSIYSSSGTVGLTGVLAVAGTGTAISLPGSTIYIGRNSSGTTTTSGNVTLTGDSLSLGSTNLSTSGALTVQPYSSSFGSALTWSGVTLGSSISGLTIGKSTNTANITLGSATSIAGPVSIYGGTVTLNAGLTTTNTSTGNIAITDTGLTGSGNISLASGMGLTVTQSGASTYGGAISGTGATLTYAGSGTLSLSGANTYTGTTAINTGTLALVGSGVLGTGTTTVASGGTLQIGNGSTSGTLPSLSNVVLNGTLSFDQASGATTTVSQAITGSGNLSQIGTGSTVVLSGANTYSGTTTVSAGTLALIGSGVLGAGTTTVASGGTLQVGNGSSSGSLPSVGSLVLNGTLSFNEPSGTTTTVGQTISGSGGLSQVGTGSTVVLTGANTYSGATTVSAGTLALSGSGTLGSTAGATTVASGATLDLQNVAVGAEALTLNGGTLLTSTGTSSLSGAVTLGASSNVSVTGTQLTLSGVVSGAYALTKAGSGTLVLSGANTYSGGTNLNAGVLNLGSSAAIGSSGTISFNGGTLQYSANNTTDYSARFSGAASQLYTLDTNGQSVTLASSLSSSGATLTKLGSGTLTLTGNNYYNSYYNLNGGVLNVGSYYAIGTSGTISFGGGTLQYSANNTTDYSSRFSTAANQAYSIDTNGQSVLYVSNLTSSGGSLTKLGAGTLSLLGSDTYSGGTTLNAGTLGVYSNSAIGTGALTVTGSSGLLLGRAVTSLSNNIVLNAALAVSYDTNVSYLVVGGGGGGAGGYEYGLNSFGGGGGGGGGVTSGTTSLIGSYSVVVGAGGTAGSGGISGSSSASAGGSGGSSALGTFTAYGGSGGAVATYPNTGDWTTWRGGVGGTSGQGYAGGSVYQGYTAHGSTPGGIGVGGSGGGGAGGAGGDGSSGTSTGATAGAGGSGLYSSLAGSYVGAGGGAGGFPGGAGGTGGGGSGVSYVYGTANTSAVNATGIGAGGGGGSGFVYSNSTPGVTSGGTGSSGIVIVQYLGSAAGTGGSVSTSGAYTTHTFTGSGTLALNALATTFGGTVSGTGALTSNASGGTLTFTGANSYSGGTTINSGTVLTNNASALGTAAVTLANSSAALLQLASNLSVGSLAGGGTSGGNVSLGSYGLTTGSNNTSTSYAGIVSGTGSLTKNGTGTLTLTGNSTYTGATTINAGILNLTNDAPTTASSSFAGAGGLVIQSASTSFSSAFSTAGWRLQPSLSSLTLGKSGNTANVTLSDTDSSGNAVTLLAPVNIYGGNVYVQTPYSWTTATTSTLSAVSNIFINANLAATGNGAGLNLFYGGTNGTTTPTAGTYYQLNLQNQSSITLSGSSPSLVIGNNVYTVYTTAAQLQAMGSSASTYVALGTALDLSSTTYTGSFYTTQFSGNFDGLGNVISGLTIRTATSGSVGFFSSLKDATVRNLGLSNINIFSTTQDASSSSYEYIGGLAGLVTGSTTAASTDVTNLSGDWVSGAISKQAGTYTYAFFAGGLVGKQNGGTLNIDRTYSSANVSMQGAGSSSYTSEAIGGLVGDVGLKVNYVTPNASAAATASNVVFNLTRSYATGTVLAGNYASYVGAGGLVGVLYSSGGSIQNSFGLGNAVGSISFGGIAGYALSGSSISNVYTTQSTAGNILGTATNVYNSSTLSTATSSGTVLPSGFSSSVWSVGAKPQLIGMPMPPTVIYVSETATSGTYGSLTFSYTLKDASGTSITLGSGAYANVSISGTGVYSIGSTTAAGSYSVSYLSGLSLTGSAASGFVLNPSSTATSYTVNKATLTITPTAASTVYGTALSLSQTAYTVSGLLFSDAVSTVSIKYAGSTSVAAGLAAGSYSLTASGASGTGLSNYNITYASGALTVTPKALTLGTVTANKVYDGTTSGSATFGALSGVYGSDSVQVNAAAATVSFSSVNVGSGLAASVSGITLTGSSAANYTLVSTASASGSITPKTLSLGLTYASSKTYDGTTSVAYTGSPTLLTAESAGAGSSSDGKPYSGDTVSLQGSLTLAYNSATVNASSIGYSGLTLSGAAAGNYVLVSSVAGTITPKALTVIGTTVANKVYDGTTAATLTGGSLSGVVNGDSVTLVQAGSFASKNAGSGVSVTASDSLSGLDIGNYTLTQPTGLTATITPKAITMSGLGATAKVYDGTTTATVTGTAALTGSETAGAGTSSDGKWYVGDTVSITGPPVGTFNSKNVSTASSVTFSGLSLTGAQAGNYTLTVESPVSATITPKTVTLSASKTYDGTTSLSSSQITLGGLVGSETLNTTAASSSDAHVGTLGKYINALTLLDGTGASSSSGGLASNYQLPTLNASNAPVTITPQVLTVSGTTVTTKVYDGTAVATLNNGALVGAVAGDVLTLSQTGTFASANAGSAIGVTASSSFAVSSSSHNSAQSDYSLSAPTGLSGSITQKLLTVTANNDAKFVTLADASGYNGLSYSGFVTGESASNLTTAPSVTRSNSAVNAAGSYNGVLVAAGGVSGNYSFSYVNGSYTIVPADQLLVKLGNTSTTYGSAPTYSLTSVQYLFGSGSSATVVDLLSHASVSASGVVTVTDTAGGTASFSVVPTSGSYSSSGALNVGSYQDGNGAVTISGNTNFTSVAVTGSQTVTPKVLTVAPTVSKTYDGSTGIAAFAYTPSGVVSGDDLTLSGAGSYATKAVGTGKSYTLTGLTLSGADAADYSIAGSTLSGSNGVITQKALTVSGIAANDKVYDGSTTASFNTANAVYSGLVAGDAVAVTATGTFGNTNVQYSSGAVAAQTVTFSSSYSGADVGNYSISSQTTASARITPKSLTLTGVAANDKVYDGTTAATLSSYGTLAGIVGSDAVSLVTSNASAGFADKNVAYSGASVTTKTVTLLASSLGLSGAQAGDYQLVTDATTTARITPRTLTVAYTGVDKTYDGTTAASVTTSDNRISGDVFTLSDSASFADKNVAYSGASVIAKTVSVSGVSLSGTDAANYTVASSGSTTAKINPKAMTVAGLAANDKVYDGGTSATVSTGNAVFSGLVSGDTVTVSASGTFADKNVGTAKAVTLTSTYAGADAGNYAITSQTGSTASITPKALTVSGISASDKTYDGGNSATVSTGSAVLGGLVSGDNVTVSASGVFSDENVARGKTVTLTSSYGGSDLGNYTVTGQATTTASIMPLTVTLSGSSGLTKVYDSSNLLPTGAAGYGSLASANSAALAADLALNGGLSLTGVASFDSANAGSRTVVQGSVALAGTRAGNYSLVWSNGSGNTITPAPLTVTANDDGKFYSQLDSTSNYAGVRYSGFVGSETASVLGGSLSVARDRSALTGTNDQDAAGTYAAKLVASGLTSSNYAITYVPGNYTIVPVGELMVKVANVSATYGSTPVYTVTSAGYMDGTNTVTDLLAAGYVSVAGAQVTVTDGSATTAQFNLGAASASTSSSGNLNVGAYSLGAGSVSTSSANFSNTIHVIGGLQVNAAGLTVTPGGVSKVYDGNTAMSNLTLTPVGVVSGTVNGSTVSDAVTVSGSGAYSDQNVTATATKGYTLSGLSLSGADAANYYLVNGSSQSGSNGQITPRTLTVTYGGVNKVYDGGTSATVTTSDDRVAGDTLAIARTAAFGNKSVAYDVNGNVTTKTVSVSGVSLSGTDAGNYVVASTGSTTATITPRTLTVAYSGVNKTYDGTTAATVTTSDNRVSGDVLSVNDSASFGDKNVGAGKTVSVSGVSLSGTDSANYSVAATGSTTANIGQRVLSVAYVGVDKVYDGSTTATVTTSDNRVSGDVLTIADSASFADKNVAANKAVSVSGVTLSGTDAANYSVVSTGSTTASITPRTLTVTYGGVNKVYDGSTAATVTTSDNRVSGDVLTVSDTANFSDKNVAYDVNGNVTSKTVNVSGVTLTGTDAANYSVASTGSTTATVTPRALSVTYVGVNKVYDGGLTASVTTADNRVSGDVFSVNDSASFRDKNAGSAKPVDVSGVSLSGADATNYTVAATGLSSAAITPRTLTVTYNGVDKVYDGGTSATVTTSDNRLSVNGVADNLTISRTAAFSDKNVAYDVNGNVTTKPVSVSGVSLSGTDALNYSVAPSGSTTAHITLLALTVGYSGVDKVYDGSTTAAVTTTDNRLTNDVFSVVRTANFDTKNVGSGKAIAVTGVSLAGTDAGNYSVAATGSTSASVSRLPSVAWTGGVNGNTSGDWLDPANWAGGAVPDLTNVAAVSIPTGVTVNFNNTPHGLAQSGTVQIDSLSAAGATLNQSASSLQVAGGLSLGTLSQSAGGLTVGNSAVLGSFAQTGGTVSVGWDVSTTTGFVQGTSGSLSAAGSVNVSATQAVVLGNLSSGESFNVTSTGGSITQASGTTIHAGLAATLSAQNGSADADLTLGEASNRFDSTIDVLHARNFSLNGAQSSGAGLALRNIQSSGTQTYAGAVSFSTDTVVTGNGVTFQGTLDATGSVIVHDSGNTVFLGAIGATSAPTHFEVDNAGHSTTLSGGLVRSSGPASILFGGDVVVTQNTVFDSSNNGALPTGANISIAGKLNGSTASGQSVTFNAGTGGAVSVAGAVGDVAALNALTLTNAASFSFAGGLHAATLVTTAQPYSVAITGLSNGVTGTSSATSFLNTGTLTLGAAANDSFSFAGGLIATAPSSVTLAGTVQTTNAPITLGGASVPVTLAANTTLSAGSGAVTLAGTVDGTTAGGQSLTVNSSGATTFARAVGASVALASMTTDAGGTVAVNGGSVTTTGAQTYGDALTLGANTTFASTGVSNVNSGVGGAISFGSTVDGTSVGAQSLTVNTTGATTFGGAVGSSLALASVTTDAGGTVAVNGGGVTTTGAQTYHDAMTLGANTTFASTGAVNVNGGAGGAITFSSTVDGASSGAQSLTVNTTGATTFGGAVGGTTALASVTTNAGGTLAVNGGSVTTTGAQTYGDAMTLGANTTFTSTGMNNGTGGAISFASTVDGASSGAQSLTVNTTGTTTFGGAVGQTTPLASVTTNAGGTVVINGGLVATSGEQNYLDAVTLGVSTILRASRVGFVSITASAAQTDLDLIAQADETLGNVSLAGDLHVSSGAGGVQGGVSQATGSALTVGGTATFTADTKTHQVAALTASNNSFGGLLTLDQANGGSWADVSVTTASALNLAPLQSAGSVNLQTQGALTTGSIAASNNLSIASHGGAVSLGQTLVSGDLSVLTSGGNLSQTGQMNVTGNTSLDASDPNGGQAGDVILSNPLNTFGGTLALQGHSTAVATSGDLNLASVHNTGSMTLITNGSMNLGSAFITNGDLHLQSQGDLTLGTAQIGGDLSMSSAAGNVSFGTVTVSGSLSTTTQGGTVDLGSATVGGGLVVQTHGGDVTQPSSGVLNVTGTSQLDAGTGQIVLGNTPNQFGGAVSLTASSAQLTAVSNLTLGASTVSGALSVQSVAGSITQTAPLTVGGTASLQAPQGSVTLSQSANVFSQPLTLNAVNATVASAQALDLAASTVSGNLSVQVAQGDLTQSGVLNVGGTSQLNVPSGNIALTDAQNQFGGAMGVTTSGTLALQSGAALTVGTVDVGGNATIQNQGAVDLGAGEYHGKLSVTTAGGALTQSGAITFKSDVDFDAGSGKIDLFDPKNLWTGSLLYKGGIVMINHPALLAANTNAASLNVRAEVFAKAEPAAPGATGTGGNAGGATNGNGATTPAATPAAPAAHSDAVISVSVDKVAGINQSGRVTVTVAADVSTTGRGFRFALDAGAVPGAKSAAEAGGPPVKASQLDGRPLPDWLKFDPVAHTFSSDSVPSGAFPIQVKLSAGGAETVVVIQEQLP